MSGRLRVQLLALVLGVCLAIDEGEEASDAPPPHFETPAALGKWLLDKEISVHNWPDGELEALYAELENGESELRTLRVHRPYSGAMSHKILSRVRHVLSIKVRHPSGRPDYLVKTDKLVIKLAADGSSEHGSSEVPIRWRMVSKLLVGGEDAREAASNALRATFSDTEPPTSVSNIRIGDTVQTFDSSRLQVEVEKLEQDKRLLRSVLNVDAENCEKLTFGGKQYQGLACAFTVHLVNAWVDGLPEGAFRSSYDAAAAATLGMVGCPGRELLASTGWEWEVPHAEARKQWKPIASLIFGVDNTLYPWNPHLQIAARSALHSFMVHKLQLPDEAAAAALIEPYLPPTPIPDVQLSPTQLRTPVEESFVKALLTVEGERKLPEGADFYAVESHYLGFGDYIVEHTDWSSLEPTARTEAFREGMAQCGALKKIAFSNSARAWVFEIFDILGLGEDIFDDHRFLPIRSGGQFEAWKSPRVFSVEDILSDTKPDRPAFQRMLRQALTDPFESVLIEAACDSLRTGKSIGMRTILVGGAMCDDPDVVDVHISSIEEVFGALAKLGYEGCCADPTTERRSLLAATLVGDASTEREGREHCALSVEWEEEWRSRITEWFRGLPILTQETLGGCLGAFALHLGGRLDALLGRSTMQGPATTAGGREPSHLDAGCELLEERAQLETLPDFPDPPARFEVPPLPRLLPSWQQQLQSLAQPRSSRGGESSAGFGARWQQPQTLPSPRRSNWVGAAQGGGVGAAVALVFVGLIHLARGGGSRNSKKPRH